MDNLEHNEYMIGTMTNEEFEDRTLDIEHYRKASVRGVIFDNENNIAIIYSPKENYYKLPGGGVEEGENDEVALGRESKEEVGVAISVGRQLGTIIEQNKLGPAIQKNRGYTAKVVGEKGTNELTDVERERKFEVHRMGINQAIELMKKTSPTSYRGRFMQTRDLQFLQAAKKIQDIV